MEAIKNVWGFVEAYYPNYSSSDEIAENDDLHKLSEGQMEEGSDAETRYKEIESEMQIMWNGADEETVQAEIDKEIDRLKNASDASVYEAAIQGYIESLKVAPTEKIVPEVDTQVCVDVFELPIGEQCAWKFGLITREVVRNAENEWEIHDTSSGWESAKVDKITLHELLTGEKSLLDLNWE